MFKRQKYRFQCY